jgi:glucosylceramidase
LNRIRPGLGAITIKGDNITRNPAYYIIAHAAKFVRPGSKRIGSNLLTNLPNVAFVNPDGKMALIVYNDDKTPQSFTIRYGEKAVIASLNPGAVATYIWE